MAPPPPTNPFRFGGLALDEAFTDREDEIRELKRDAVNGQDVVVFAPRRYGKSSLVWRVAQELVAEKVLVAQIDLMTTPTKEKLAAKLAKAIHDEIASPLFKARDRLQVFAGLRITPTVTVDPADGSLGFSFTAGREPADIDDPLERLLALPARLAAERRRKVILVFDEFQEIADIDAHLPKLMRAVFQQQADVAHVYLGSKRHMMRRIFSDAQEPFWRSAKQMELGVIAPEHFRAHIERRFAETGRRIAPETIERVLAVTGGHPYGTQELCYSLWEATPSRGRADLTRLDGALDRVLRSEHAHFSLVWDRASAVQRRLLQALADEAGRPLSQDYQRRHQLPGASSVQKAMLTLEREELVARVDGQVRIVEPFLAEWLRLNAG